jgi:hypothetical protein
MRKTIFATIVLAFSSTLSLAQPISAPSTALADRTEQTRNDYRTLASAIENCTPMLMTTEAQSWTIASLGTPLLRRDGRANFIHRVFSSRNFCIYVRSTPDELGLVCLLTDLSRRRQFADVIRELYAADSYEMFPWAEFCGDSRL